MLEKDVLPIQINSHLRPLDMRRDLRVVADLIEQSFASTMDPDGREYLRQMRQMARDETLLRWSARSGDTNYAPLHGYVWEEDNRVVGNLSLIPFRKQGRRIYLIANVAVHPNYRRRGIARALTQAAIGYAQQHGAEATWLQVRAENAPAIHLYQGLGFAERFQRTTWLSESPRSSSPSNPGMRVTSRKSSDWKQHRLWLLAVYPPEVAWNLPIDLNRLRPSLINNLYLFMLNASSRHWAVRRQGELLGLLSWESTHTYADNLWLALPPQADPEVVQALLRRVRRDIPPTRPLALNFPAGQFSATFEACNFFPHQTLIWMEVSFKETNQIGVAREG